MLAAILSFTAEGEHISSRLGESLKKSGYEVLREHFGSGGTKLSGEIVSPESGNTRPITEKISARDFVSRLFPHADLLIFVGACGIAVRLIAPHVRDKKTDPAVLVADEQGRFIIPLLSGHLGGANRYAQWLADELGATAVITTATDLEGRFAPDLFAKKYHLNIRSMEDAKAVAAAGLHQDVKIVFDVPCRGELPPEKGACIVYRSRKTPERNRNQTKENQCEAKKESEILEKTERNRSHGGENQCDARKMRTAGKESDISEKPEMLPCLLITNAEKTETLGHPQCVLTPKNLIVGIGCRRGTEAEKIIAFVREIFSGQNLSTDAILSIASIDIKRDEPGLICAAENFSVPFYTASAEELNSLRGDYTTSEFVRRQTGTDNVCERSAVMAGMKSESCPGQFLVRKQARDGVTIAVYEVAVEVP